MLLNNALSKKKQQPNTTCTYSHYKLLCKILFLEDLTRVYLKFMSTITKEIQGCLKVTLMEELRNAISTWRYLRINSLCYHSIVISPVPVDIGWSYLPDGMILDHPCGIHQTSDTVWWACDLTTVTRQDHHPPRLCNEKKDNFQKFNNLGHYNAIILHHGETVLKYVRRVCKTEDILYRDTSSS